MVQGTEHEYTLYSDRLNPRGIDPHRLALELLWKSNLAAGGEFLRNGSRAYFDVGHLEISTAETLTAQENLVYEKAGERIVDLIRLKLEEAHNVKINAFKNNTDPDGVSYGSHENYCVPREIAFPDAYLKALVPHLVTRIIFTGAGDFIDHRYVLSPCAYLTSQIISGGNLSNTGILHTRDEPHADPEKWRRLHVIIGDALMSEIGIWLRHFTTQGVLECMTHGELEDAPVLANPLEDMWNIVEHPDPKHWIVTVGDGKRMKATDVQRYYLAKIEEHVSTQTEKKAIQVWGEILDDFDAGIDTKKTSKLARRVDWVARLREIERVKDLKGYKEYIEVAACKQYSELSSARGLYYRLESEGSVERVTTDAEIKQAMTTPPKTRAMARTALLTDYEVSTADWAEVRVLTEGGGTERIQLLDPYKWDLEGIA